MFFYLFLNSVIEGALIGAAIGGLIGLIVCIPLMIKQSKINKGIAKGKPGSRYKDSILYSGNKSSLDTKIKDYLKSKNYIGQNYVNEFVYRNGSGILTASKFFKYELADGNVKIEAFIIPFGAKEVSLNGAVGAIPKKQLKQLVDGIIEIIKKSN